MKQRFAVIMAGGRGERFWPQSRLKHPKHLLSIVGTKPMLVQTLARLEGVVPIENILVITNREQKEAILNVCSELNPEQVISEPIGRDTAAAIGLAMLLVRRREPQATFAVFPADAIIQNLEAFRSVLTAAFEAAEDPALDALVTIGIEPSYPATGYGYLKRGFTKAELGKHTVYQVEQFVEKPDIETAQRYYESDDYFWNAGMFAWSVSAISRALEEHVPSLWEVFRKMESALDAGASLDELLAKHYPEIEKVSIDYAVMEKSRNVAMVKGDFDWDDVGEWPAIARHHKPDKGGNVIKGEAIIQNGKGNIVVNQDGHLTALMGVDDLMVIQTEDATLVCPRDKAQEIKQLVHQMSQNPEWRHLA